MRDSETVSKIEIQDLSVSFGDALALRNIDLEIPAGAITALIGPSGCGKSTLLRSLNRMNDLVANVRVNGRVLLEGEDVYENEIDVSELRRRVGMVFQKPNLFPRSVFENVAYGLRIQGVRDRHLLEGRVRESLEDAALWTEVSDRLDLSALALSGGQQQRLCIARALAVDPEVLLMDEPGAALDPIATGRIESLIRKLKEQYTIVIVTHNMQQAARLSDFTAFLNMGELIEVTDTQTIFTKPSRPETEDYVTGRFG